MTLSAQFGPSKYEGMRCNCNVCCNVFLSLFVTTLSVLAGLITPPHFSLTSQNKQRRLSFIFFQCPLSYLTYTLQPSHGNGVFLGQYRKQWRLLTIETSRGNGPAILTSQLRYKAKQRVWEADCLQHPLHHRLKDPVGVKDGIQDGVLRDSI